MDKWYKCAIYKRETLNVQLIYLKYANEKVIM